MSFITTAVSAIVKFIPPKIVAFSNFPNSSNTVATVVKGLPPTISAKTRTESFSSRDAITFLTSTEKPARLSPSFKPIAMTSSTLSEANIERDDFNPSASPP